MDYQNFVWTLREKFSQEIETIARLSDVGRAITGSAAPENGRRLAHALAAIEAAGHTVSVRQRRGAIDCPSGAMVYIDGAQVA